VASTMREALIRPSAISHNVGVLAGQSSAHHTMVVVKAQGYGHGAVTAATAALDGGATWLGTADIDEALELRGAGITAPALAWLFGPNDDLSMAREQGIDLGVSSLEQLAQVTHAHSGAGPQRVHLKVDTGLSRSGAVRDSWDALFAEVARAVAAGRVEVIGMFSHLSGTSLESDRQQGELFEQALGQAASHGITPELRHLSASAAASDAPELAYDMVRLGIAAYGYPTSDSHRKLGLRPAMRVSGQVVLTKTVDAGRGVGYGHTYVTSSRTRLALVPLGYADGVPRQASSKGPVAIDGRHYTVSGRVSMDQFSVDVGDDDVQVGQWCVLWGDPAEGHPSVDEWAEVSGTIGYDIVTGVGSRVVRVVES
jgi:alanine racemase